MSLPRKKSRAITVGQQHYRWLITKVDENFVTKWIMQSQSGGCRLVHVRNVRHLSRMAIGPRYVAAVIKHALQDGWQPSVRGRDMAWPSDKSSTKTRMLGCSQV